MDDTIQDLNRNLEDAKSGGPPPLLGMEEGGEQMLGMVKDLMGDLLSEEVLYEPMKDLCLRYPKYLDEEELSGEDRKRYLLLLLFTLLLYSASKYSRPQ